MSRVLSIFLATLLGLSCAAPAFAEIIVLPNGHPQAEKLAKQPTRGMTMKQVRTRFGAPLKALPPTRTAPHYPTITRWIYSQYTVYFADDHVVHTVVHSNPTTSPAPSK